MSYHIGIGYDIHRLIEGSRLFLGGVEIPYTQALSGHSDGDVLLHAISDALLGAIAEPDIGMQFPDTDPQYQGIASSQLLKKVVNLVTAKNFKVHNIDTVIIAQEPLLAPFKKPIQKTVADIIGINENAVSIKAKTNEGLGEIGSKQAIACYAVVTVSSAL